MNARQKSGVVVVDIEAVVCIVDEEIVAIVEGRADMAADIEARPGDRRQIVDGRVFQTAAALIDVRCARSGAGGDQKARPQ